MLSQRTQHTKFLATRLEIRASINLILVTGTLQVGIESFKDAERAVAEEALVCGAIPGAFGGPGRRHGRRGISIRSTDKPRRVRDNIVAIHAHDHAVELVARESRRTRSRLKVQHQRGVRYKGPSAVGSGAAHVQGFVDRRVEVRFEVVFVHEDAAAIIAIPVLLTIVLVQARRRLECLHLRYGAHARNGNSKNTYNTTREVRIVHLIVVIFQLVIVVEMFVTHLTIVVPTTLDIVVL